MTSISRRPSDQELAEYAYSICVRIARAVAEPDAVRRESDLRATLDDLAILTKRVRAAAKWAHRRAGE